MLVDPNHPPVEIANDGKLNPLKLRHMIDDLYYARHLPINIHQGFLRVARLPDKDNHRPIGLDNARLLVKWHIACTNGDPFSAKGIVKDWKLNRKEWRDKRKHEMKNRQRKVPLPQEPYPFSKVHPIT